MVVKKYLCAAPRPDSWEEKAHALLQSFHGNLERRDETLRQTLQQLQAIRTYERRTGPGRKSNAEHAIAFYEYVLGVGESGDDDSDEKDDDDYQEQNGVDQNDTVKGGRTCRGMKDEKEEGEEDDNQDSDDDKPEEEEEKTIESMDSQEFLNQHNDACEVCNLGGDLLCCSTCSLVFHLACVRPKLEKLPVGDWSCAYCILSTGGYKKHSKVWKAASAAVRHMERLRDSKQEDDSEDDNTDNENDNDNDDEDDDIDGKKDNGKQPKKFKPDETTGADTNKQDPDGSESVAETEKHDNISHAEEEKGPVRRNSAMTVNKIAEALSPKVDKEKLESTGRGRRPRRQPILYDPQTGPDSRWKSDVTQIALTKTTKTMEENASGADDEEDELEIPMSSRRRRRSGDKTGGSVDSEAKESSTKDESPTESSISVHENKTVSKKESGSDDDDDEKNTYWCNFCQDDPKVPICVFCACRICFGKHDKDKILLCDQCDDEYHTFCLNPPLAAIPNTKKWFCPTCKAATLESSNTENKVATRRCTSSPTKSTGAATGTPNSNRATSSKKENQVPYVPYAKSTSSVSSSNNDAITPKKSRGRPCKIKTPPPPPSSDPAISPRKRGRPPKTTVALTSPSPGDTSGRKRGRPPKNAIAAAASPPSPVRKKLATKPVSSNKRSISPSTRKADASVVSKKARTESSNNPSEGAPAETPPEPFKTSRSGRVVKRSSFHDEMEEGEQHLRSSRSKTDAESDDDEMGMPTQESDETNNGVLAVGDSITAEGTTSQDPSVADDEISEDTMHGRPVRTKIIDPPNTTLAVPETLPRIPMDVTQAEVSPREPPATGDATPSNNQVTQEQEAAISRVDKVASPRVEHSPKEITDAKPAGSTGKSIEAPISTSIFKEASDTSSQAPLATKESPLPSTKVPAPLPSIPPIALPTPTSKVLPKLDVDVKALVKAAIAGIPMDEEEEKPNVGPVKVPRRKPGARECMQISRRFGVRAIPKKYMDTLLDYCTRGKVEHLIRMRERLDEHSRFLESQLAGLEALVQEVGETDVVVPPLPERAQNENQTSKPFQQLSVKSSDEGASSPPKSTSSTPMTEAAVAPNPVSTIPSI